MNNHKKKISGAPAGAARIKWLGPAFIWMLSAAGSGELLFTPRIASQYGYAFIWALILSVIMKWCINREIGRFTVCTGASFFSGIASLSRSGKHLLWLIVLPQLVVAVATIAGLAGAAATAIAVMFKSSLLVTSVILIVFTALISLLGRYNRVEKIMTPLAILITVSILAAAISTAPDIKAIASGFIPSIPEGTKTDEVFPWLGFMLAGAAGMMWFSYWVDARGYGASALHTAKPLDLQAITEDEKTQLKGWIRQVTIANSLAVIGAVLIALAFLVLGTELLKPRGLIPEENKVAETLGQLMGGIWGLTGFWFMIGAVFITFMGSLLSDQDGFRRMFTDGFQILLPDEENARRRHRLIKWLIILILILAPGITYVIAGEPVSLLKLAGAIEAAHIPIVASLILYLNKKTLPAGLAPGPASFISTAIAALSFAAFAVVFFISVL